MAEIIVSGLVKGFDQDKNILDGLTFTVDPGERVGILGKNGAGKSTLFKILTGELNWDEGTLIITPGQRLGLISQIPVYPDGFTVENVLRTAFANLFRIQAEMESLTRQMEQEDKPELLRRYGDLSAAFESGGGYGIETEIDKVCNGLQISQKMRNQLFASLSGGEKTRVNLGRLILEDTDILLLDEPTNHLDIRATEWLEEYLRTFRGTVLTASHDRYFLDRVITRVIEIADGKAEFYSGNYSFYAKEKESRYLAKLKQYEKEQAKIAQLTEAAEKMHLWAFMGNDKLHKRAFSMEKRIERIAQTDKPTKEKKLKGAFEEKGFFGDEIFSVHRLSKSFAEREIFRDVELKMSGGERIALLGDNGTGKSTFLKTLLNEEKADSGSIHFGPSVKWGYLPQIIRFDNPERSLVDTLIYELDCTAQTARNRLGSFHFRGEEVFQSVKTLSGGEQSRLRLCILMASAINLLILDEPTNHLDLQSREWMEDAIDEYEGGLLFVSHDRYFIRKFATRIWMLENGEITDFKGNYDAFQAARMSAATSLTGTESVRLKKEKEPVPKKPEKKKNSKATERILGVLEREIAAMEEKIAELEQQMEEKACDYDGLSQVYEEKLKLESELEARYEKWEELASRIE